MTRKQKLASVFAAVALVALTTVAVVKTSNDQPFGRFFSKCTFDHSAMDDPIVHPGMPGGSHMHDFFAAVGVDAFTKPADKVGGPTTCVNPKATQAYWFPALYDNGVKVDPLVVNATYSAGGKDRATIQTLPAGLVMVAGSLVPPLTPTGSNRVDWDCSPKNHPYSTSIGFQPCPFGNLTTVRLSFPDCWDGKNLDSPNHRSHMAYSERPAGVKGQALNVCPPGFIPVPQVALGVVFPVGVKGPVLLASGDSKTWHGDFMNSWDQTELNRLVTECIVGQKDCGQEHP